MLCSRHREELYAPQRILDLAKGELVMDTGVW